MAENALRPSPELVVIGGSAGSLEVLFPIFREIRERPFPILIVLHRRGSSDSQLAALLGAHSVVPVKEVDEKEMMLQGRAYIAPTDYHVLVEKNGMLSLDASEKVNFSRPSLDVTFESAADAFGRAVVGILLSGGNIDGVAGLAAIRSAGGLTVVQSPDSSTVPYMPRHAVDRGLADRIIAAADLPAFINQL